MEIKMKGGGEKGESWSKKKEKKGNSEACGGEGGTYLHSSFCWFHTKYLRVRVASVYWVNIPAHG